MAEKTKVYYIQGSDNKFYRLENIQIFPHDGTFRDYKGKVKVELKSFDSLSDLQAGINGTPVNKERKITKNESSYISTFFDSLLSEVKTKEISGTIKNVDI